jgi:hypothetical protein
MNAKYQECLDLRAIACYCLYGENRKQVAMKTRLFRVCFALLAMLGLTVTSTYSAAVISFDDLFPPLAGLHITNAYQGLIWTNFSVVNAIDRDAVNGLSGYSLGMVSPSNVAYNAFGSPAEIDATGTNFNFLSVYFTGAWRSNLNIEVQGFRGATLIYDQTVVASATNPTLLAFNYQNVDRLYFNGFGGQHAGFGGDGEHFVMDNFTFEFVPEPSSVLLAAVGALLLWPLLKRKRA